MLRLGIDVVILSGFAMLFTLIAAVISYVCCFSREKGNATVYSTLIACSSMVFVYVVMAKVLDSIVGL